MRKGNGKGQTEVGRGRIARGAPTKEKKKEENKQTNPDAESG
jgi:hypothetical protein